MIIARARARASGASSARNSRRRKKSRNDKVLKILVDARGAVATGTGIRQLMLISVFIRYLIRE